MVLALSLVSLDQSPAQLVINVYPSQGNPTSQTLWIFRGSSTPITCSNILFPEASIIEILEKLAETFSTPTSPSQRYAAIGV